jgi:hypothetical protein
VLKKTGDLKQEKKGKEEDKYFGTKAKERKDGVDGEPGLQED